MHSDDEALASGTSVPYFFSIKKLADYFSMDYKNLV